MQIEFGGSKSTRGGEKVTKSWEKPPKVGKSVKKRPKVDPR